MCVSENLIGQFMHEAFLGYFPVLFNLSACNGFRFYKAGKGGGVAIGWLKWETSFTHVITRLYFAAIVIHYLWCFSFSFIIHSVETK